MSSWVSNLNHRYKYTNTHTPSHTHWVHFFTHLDCVIVVHVQLWYIVFSSNIHLLRVLIIEENIWVVHFIFQCTTTFYIWIKKKHIILINCGLYGWFRFLKCIKRKKLLYLCRVFWGCPRIQDSARPPRRDWGRLNNSVKENLKRKIFASFSSWFSELFSDPRSSLLDCPGLEELQLRLLTHPHWCGFKSRLTVSSLSLLALRFVCRYNLIKPVSLNVLGECGF